jgi:hypothetical protein
VLPDVDVSFPLGSTDRELMHLVEDSEARVPWTAEVVVCLCRIMESIETMEDVLEILETTGETVRSETLPPQKTMSVAILSRVRSFKKLTGS